MADEEKETGQSNKDIDKLIKKVLHDKLTHYITGKITSELTRMHYGNALKKKSGVVKEEAPTNVMGTSSSTEGTGAIDTFDPLLATKKKLARKKKVNDGTAPVTTT